MTNAEKYLKVSVDEFIKELGKHKIGSKLEKIPMLHLELMWENIKEFLNTECKPKLIENERFILRNFKKDYITLGRDKVGDLFIATERDEDGIRGRNDLAFEHNLFPFIKEGEEYPIEELLK